MVDMDLIILGVLQGMPMHGYQLKQQIEASFGKQYFNMSNSALYPKLTKLETDGYISSRREQQEKVPDRKVYSITEAGRKRLHDLVVQPLGPREDFQDFQAHAVFFGMLTPEERMVFLKPLLKEAEGNLKDALTKHDQFSKYMDRYSLLILNNGISEIRNQIRLYKQLMDIE
jgi:DNA-binding PadR family transcriptional regulator